MKVINYDKSGNEIDDLSKIEISENHPIYTVIQGIDNARTSNKVLQETREE